jgi:hypothetical protein
VSAFLADASYRLLWRRPNDRTRESKRRRAQRARDLEKRRRERALDPTLSRDDQILTFKQWCQLNAISERTGARILADPHRRPPIVQLSAKRIGIRVIDNHLWQASRTQGPAV